MGQYAPLIVAGSFTSLFISSILISFFVLNMYGLEMTDSAVINMPNDLPTYTNSRVLANSQDFTGSAVNESDLSFYGSWSHESGIGYVLKTLPIGGNNGWIYELYVITDSSGFVTNKYQINNSALGDYGIVLRVAPELFDSDNIIWVKEDGFHVYDTGWFSSSERAFISMPNANKIKDVIITTTYDVNNDYAVMNFNNVEYKFSNLNTPSILSYGGVPSYGGVISNSIGFALKFFYTASTGVASQSSTSGTSATSSLEMIASLIIVMLHVVTYTLPASIMPLSLQALLIVPQEGLLLIGIADWIRS